MTAAAKSGGGPYSHGGGLGIGRVEQHRNRNKNNFDVININEDGYDEGDVLLEARSNTKKTRSSVCDGENGSLSHLYFYAVYT